jgi:hypothetical protein
MHFVLDPISGDVHALGRMAITETGGTDRYRESSRSRVRIGWTLVGTLIAAVIVLVIAL